MILGIPPKKFEAVAITIAILALESIIKQYTVSQVQTVLVAMHVSLTTFINARIVKPSQ